MILHQLAEHLAASAGHVLAYAPGDPTPTSGAVPDPASPRSISMGSVISFLLVFVLMPLLIFVGFKVIAKGGANGELKQGFQMTLGALLGITIIAIALGGGIVGLLMWSWNKATGTG